ncbi:hypothetical protein D3C85_1676500 [compost metagenome]
MEMEMGKQLEAASSKRSLALADFRIAGFHQDNKSFTRLLIERRVKRSIAEQQFLNGQALRAKGATCSCMQCKAVA